MDVSLLRFLAQTFGATIISSSRPGLTFMIIQWTIGILIRMDMAALPDGMVWLVSAPTMVIAALLAIAETWAQHDADIAELLRELKIHHLLGAFGAFSSVLLFTALGLPEGDGVATATVPEPTLFPMGMALAAGAEQPAVVRVGAVAGAVIAQPVLGWARGTVMSFLADLDLEATWARLETGGAVGLLLALLLAPFLAAAFLLLTSVALVVIAVWTRLAKRSADLACRVPCVHCGHAVRPEARRCPRCNGDLEPKLVLTGTMAQRGWKAARERMAAMRKQSA